MDTIRVTAQQANAQNFRKYGCILEKPDSPANYEDQECLIWYDLAQGCNFGAFPNINYYFLKQTVPATTQIFKVSTDEAYFNTGGGRIVYFAADNLPDGSPAVSTIKAFYTDGMSLLLKAGVWRTQPFSPDADNTVLLLMDRNNVYFDESRNMRRDPARVVEYNLSDRYLADL